MENNNITVIIPINGKLNDRNIDIKIDAKKHYVESGDGEYNFCAMINKAVQEIDTNYFCIVKPGDEFNPNWFNMFNNYYVGNESISLFLPVDIIKYPNDEWKFANELALASSFTNELGIIDSECLESYRGFMTCGGIFNKKDFIECGMYKPSIKYAYDYELMLRMVDKGLKIMVIPKEGYILSSENLPNIDCDDLEIEKWFELAKRECKFTEDRNKGISKNKEVELK